MVRWKDAAARNPVLTAAELYFMARPDERVPWRELLSFPPPRPSDAASPSAPTPAPEKWGARKRRSSKATGKAVVVKEAEEEKAPGRASPTTPLSWNACEFARDPTPTKKRPFAAGSAVNAGRGGCRGGGGSVKLATELKERERSLLEQNTLLKKEVQAQKLAQSMLIQENERLKSLKSKLHQVVAVAETGASDAKSEERKREQQWLLPFDLNLPFPADTEVATE